MLRFNIYCLSVWILFVNNWSTELKGREKYYLSSIHAWAREDCPNFNVETLWLEKKFYAQRDYETFYISKFYVSFKEKK